jgi:diadenosine tetraphosphate (Ap4A) HIT family hydrolase
MSSNLEALEQAVSCTFCDQFRDMYNFGILEQYIGQWHRIVWQTSDFVIVPSVGPLTEGHVLVIPRQHYLSFRSLPGHLHDDAVDVLNVVGTVVESCYGPFVCFEHGSVGDSVISSGASTVHAHLHIVPCVVDLMDIITKKFRHQRLKGLRDLFSIRSDKPYLYFASASGGAVYAEVDHQLPNQYLRREICKLLGKPDKWDWRVYMDIESLKRTKDRLMEYFQREHPPKERRQ